MSDVRSRGAAGTYVRLIAPLDHVKPLARRCPSIFLFLLTHTHAFYFSSTS